MIAEAVAVPGYVHEVVGAARVLARESALRSVASALESAGTLHRYAATHPEARGLTGRETLYVLPSPATPEGEPGRWVVRHLSHGGLLAPLTRDLFPRLGLPRPFNEVMLSVELRRTGIATPEVVAAVVYPTGPFYRGDVARRWVSGTVDLAERLFGEARGDASVRIAALAAAGRLVRDLHYAGVFHPDLNARNILVETVEEEPRAYIIDLEKCRMGRSTRGRREIMLGRLRRSLRKFEAASGSQLSEDELEAFRWGYG